jgi:hypothetical protein
MFNHHPACVFGLRRAGYNLAETVQIEIEDFVIALPSQVDAQSALGNVFVQAQNERCILQSFHFRLVSFVLVIFVLFRSPSLQSQPVTCSSFQVETLGSYAPLHPDLTY